MLRKQSGLLYATHQATDLLIVTICLYCAYLTKIALPGGLGVLANADKYDFLFLIALVSFYISLRLFGAYEQYRKLSLRRVIFRTFKATLTGMAGIIFLCYLMHFQSVVFLQRRKTIQQPITLPVEKTLVKCFDCII